MKNYHFIGIGGIGMSALARILLGRGQKVSGSDLSLSGIVLKLKEEGAEIFIGHRPENIQGANVVVYSTDIAQDNPEFTAAKEKKITLLHRSQLLAQLMEGYAPLLVTGTHGKTTTSSLLAHLLLVAGLDPCYAIGGIVQGLKTNGGQGKGVYFVAEADESDGSFLNYPSFGAIITNLENDHMNYWKEPDAIDKAFAKFASSVGSSEHLFWCGDDPRLVDLGLKGYSYGFSDKVDLKIESFRQEGWKVIFDVTFEERQITDIELPLIGGHNVLNATAVLGMGLKLDLNEEVIKKALATFPGVGRRVEKKGDFAQIEIYDDYAHHPTEIFSTLRALKMATHNRRLVVAFQPHRYTRTRDCMEDFSEAFHFADALVITDIYAAREQPLPGITANTVLDRVKKASQVPAHYVERDRLSKYLTDFLKPGDILVTMGAGDITNVGPAVLEALKKR